MLIDRSVDRLADLSRRIRSATSFAVVLPLVFEKKALEERLQKETAEVNRTARGWLFVAPPSAPVIPQA